MVLYTRFASYCHDYDVVNLLRSSVAHSTPTAGEGRNILLSDPRLSNDEKHFVEQLIPCAKDKKGELLFTMT